MPLVEPLTQDTPIVEPVGVPHHVSFTGNPPIPDSSHVEPAGVTHNVSPIDEDMSLYDAKAQALEEKMDTTYGT